MDAVLDAGNRHPLRWLAPATIRKTLLVVLLVALVPVLLVQAALHYNRFQEERAQELEANLELARAVAGTFDGYTDHILSQELAIGVAFTSAQPLDETQATRLLTESLLGYPSLRYYNWLDPSGRVVASSLSNAVGLDLSDRAYFQQIAEGREWVVGDLMVGRLTSEPTFAVARGIRDAGGALLGVVVALVDPDNLGDVLGVQRAGKSDIAILDGQGFEVYRYPEVRLTREQRTNSSSSPATHAALAGEEIATISPSPLDGRESMVALAPIRSIGWVAGASHPVDEAMAPVLEDLAQDFSLLLLVAAVSFGVALLSARYLTVPMGRLRNSAIALGRGQLARAVKVVGPAEVEDLADAFNRMAQEIAQREAQREQLLRRQREMLERQEDLLRTVSHDLRTPLTSIQGYAQFIEYVLEKEGRLGDAKRSARTVAASAKQMNVMIQDLVDGARIESGQLTLNQTAVPLGDVISGLKEGLAGAIDVDRIETQLPEMLPAVWVDPPRLERILTNIVSNALKYSPSTTPVVISAEANGDWVTVSVTDQGTGIAADDLPHLFDRYYRAAGTRKTEGLGLGLYVTRALVEAHGGRIWVESEVGTGASFHFTIPMAGIETGGHREKCASPSSSR